MLRLKTSLLPLCLALTYWILPFQQQLRDAPMGLYLRTLDGRVLAVNAEENAVNLVYDFDIDPGNGTIAFSDRANRIAYVTQKDGDWTLGIGDITTQRFTELPLIAPVELNNVALSWLPSGKHILLSYMADNEEHVNSVIQRYLLTIDSANNQTALIDFPYTCGQFAIQDETKLILQCSLVEAWNADNNPVPLSAWFDFEQQEILQGNSNASVIGTVEDIINRNWIWSPNRGLVFFDAGIGNNSRGFYLLPKDSPETQKLSIETPWTGKFYLSPNENFLLFRDATPTMWGVYDFSEDMIISTMEIPNLETSAGVVWFEDEMHIAYVTYDSDIQQSEIHIGDLSASDEKTLEVEGIVFELVSFFHDRSN
jgi:hypothetical protein